MRLHTQSTGCRLATLVATAGLWLATSFAASAQNSDPLALSNTNSGYDSAASKKVLSEEFAGIWRVTHQDKEGRTWSGQARIPEDGSSIQLTLEGPEVETNYELIEADAWRANLGPGSFKKGLIARFRKTSSSWIPADGFTVDSATPLSIPSDQPVISFENAESELALPIVWAADRIRVNIGTKDEENIQEGLWVKESRREFIGGGTATWIRGDVQIEGVAVIEDQFDPSAGTSYPFTPDGDPIKHTLKHRTLVVYGKNLPEFADGAEIQSISARVIYSAVDASGEDRNRLIARTLERAKVKDPSRFDAFIVKANLSMDILPGTKRFSVNGEPATWPLAFANQDARMYFTRSDGDPTTSFFVGDAGQIDIAFKTDMPYQDIGIRLMKGDERPIEMAVLLARRLPSEEGDQSATIYRSDPFHIFHPHHAERSPPKDYNAFRVPGTDGMVLHAELIDRNEALGRFKTFMVPLVARAQIYDDPRQLGSLWEETLRRIATKCYGKDFDDPRTYQREPAETISQTIFTENFGAPANFAVILALLNKRGIQLEKGDHAAAVLIRDEFVPVTLQLVQEFEKIARSRRDMRDAMDRANKDPGEAAKSFWQDSKAFYMDKRGWRAWVPNPVQEKGHQGLGVLNEIRLVDALDTAAIAKQFEITQDQAQEWAERQTIEAAKKQVARMEAAVTRALDAGDCDVGALLIVAGHKSDRVVNRILPRLVKQEIREGPPRRQNWVSDTDARNYVKSLHVPGAAVRELEKYSSLDTDVALAVAAIGTGGMAYFGQGAVGVVGGVAATAADLVIGLHQVKRYSDGEAEHELALGSEPAMGEDILWDAKADRQSALGTVLGVLLTGAGAAAQVKHLRHFKNIQKGKDLLRGQPGALSDLTALSETQRASLAGYYTDLFVRAKRSGLDKFDDIDRSAYNAFNDYFKTKNLNPPEIEVASLSPTESQLADTIAEPTPAADPRLADTITEQRMADFDPNETLPPPTEGRRVASPGGDSFDRLDIGTPENPANTGGTAPTKPSGEDSFDRLDIGTPENPANTGGTAPTKPSGEDSFDRLDIGTPENPANTGGTAPTKPSGEDSFDRLDIGTPENPARNSESGPTLRTDNLDPGGVTQKTATPRSGAEPELADTIQDPGPGTNPDLADTIREPSLSQSPTGSQFDETIDGPGPAGDPRLDDTITESAPAGDPRLDPTGRDLADVLRSQPLDDSPPLPIPAGTVSDLGASRPGALTRHLSADEVAQFFDPNRVLTPYQVIQKADLIRDGRVPLRYAQGDPEVTNALNDVFGLGHGRPSPAARPGRRQPSLTEGGTTIDPIPGNGPDLADTLPDPGPATGSNPELADTVRDPSPLANPDLTETVDGPIFTADAGSDPNATLPPAAGFNPSQSAAADPFDTARLTQPHHSAVSPATNAVPHDELAQRLAQLENQELHGLRTGVPGSDNRLWKLDLARKWLSQGTPEQLKTAAGLDGTMRELGVRSYDAMGQSALHYRRTDFTGLSPKMTQAQIVAEGIMLYGQRPVSITEFAMMNNLAPTAARAVAERAAQHLDVPPTGPAILPFSSRKWN